MNSKCFHLHEKAERGAATLLVTVILLALITLVTVYITKLGLLEVKTGANANRAKEALHHAQGGLDYGALMYLDQGSSFASAAISLNGTSVSISSTVSGSIYTLSATGESLDGTGSETVQEGYGRFPLLGFGKLPPLMSNGSYTPTGSISIIANPNGGGNGVPVSAWVASDAVSGSWQTCNVDEWLQEDTGGWVIKDEGTDDEFILCASCDCQQVAQIDEEGLCWDQMDGGLTSLDQCEDIVVDTSIPDVFWNLFGVCVAEVIIGGVTYCEGPDANYDNEWEAVKFSAGEIFTDCDDFKAAGPTNIGKQFYDAGRLPLIWIEDAGGCNPDNVGSYEYPVILVQEGGELTLNGNSGHFGIFFAFTDIYPTPPAASSDYTTMKLVGGAHVYGSLLTNTDVGLPAGSFTLVYSESVLKKISTIGDSEQYGIGRRSGSWSDI